MVQDLFPWKLGTLASDIADAGRILPGMKTLSRRELARILAALPAAQALPLGAQAPQSSGYIGPLTGVTTGIADRGFDPVVFTRDLYAAAPRRLRFQANARGPAEAWQKQLRAKLSELIGAFDPTPTKTVHA